ncbi:type II toxin-antitoxin system RelB family antitoxin [Exiguobacterium mexicanum]|uniref:type II toxin-antitoxin system RelB family antitoxin n=2 Tax=Exiguobacterium TaxID=33986 RepID=UPI00360AD1D3
MCIKEVNRMGMISVRLNEEDERLIRGYARSNNLSLSTLVRDAVLKRIEDEHDLKLYSEAMSVHQKHSEAISFDNMVKDLNK